MSIIVTATPILLDELQDLADPADGRLDVVDDLRTNLGADLQAFLPQIAQGNHGGIAYLNAVTSVTGYSQLPVSTFNMNLAIIWVVIMRTVMAVGAQVVAQI